MKRKYSKRLIWAVIDFVKIANEELGGKLGDQQAYAMLDAFDPALKRQMLLELMLGHTVGAMRIRRDPDITNRKKIEAIKQVRTITRFALREAKDVVDTADTGIAEIPGSWTIEEYNALAYNLIGTGYELV